jgi:ABC-type phosphate/phosphonate transport system substrate-binding protein
LCFILAALAATAQAYGDTESAVPNKQRVVRIGGLSQQFFNTDRKDATIAAELFFKELIGRVGYKSEFVVLQSHTQLLAAMRENKLDTVFSNPIDYLDMDLQVNPDFRYTLRFGSFGVGPEQRIYLLTQTKDEITQISQLRGKRLAITEGDLLGITYLEVFLAKAGQPGPETFFSTIEFTTSNAAAVLDLFFNKADLAVTTDVTYALANELNPQLQDSIEILDISDPYIPFVIGVNKQAPPSRLTAIDDILLHIKEEPKLSHILSLFGATDVVKIRSEQLDSLRMLKSQHEQLIPKTKQMKNLE